MTDKSDEYNGRRGGNNVMTGSLKEDKKRFLLEQAKEVDFVEMCKILWKRKWWIITSTFIFGFFSIFYALNLPNMYKSEGVYAFSPQSGNAGGMASKFGGLAAIAGISLRGNDSGDLEEAMAFVKSWPFSEYLVNKYKLKPYIMGLKRWDMENDLLVWDSQIYDPEREVWLREPPAGKKPEPSSFETYKKFRKMIFVNNDVKTGLIKISVEHYSPKIAKDWVDLIVAELNEYFQNKDIDDAKKSIEYLNKKISETNVSEMRSVFYQMIEEQTKTLMLAEVSDEYLLKTVITPKEPEEKNRPKRSFVVIIITGFGAIVSIGLVLALSFYSKVKADEPI